MTTLEFDKFTPRQTDDELAFQLTCGEPEPALSTLRQRYAGIVTRFAERIVRDRHTADDVAQEVFVKVFLKPHLYRPGTNFRVWLLGVARNQALNTVRRERRTARPVSTIDVEFDSQRILEGNFEDRRAEEREFMRAFDDEVRALPPRNQTVFCECVMADRSYRDVATELGLPIGTVAIRIMRARQRLFRRLSKHLDRLRRPPACVQ